jgi:hypothetical protein
MKQMLLMGFGFAFVVSGCITGDENKTQVPLAPTEKTTSVNVDNLTSIQWIDSVKEMGTILEGQKLEVAFRFRNSGNKPLVIESATPSCGCTVPSKPDKPIMPGDESEIKAVFDSQGRTGTNHKTITVVANTIGSTNHSLTFTVQVLGAKDGPKPAAAPTKQF